MSESVEDQDGGEIEERPNGSGGRAISGDDIEDLKRQLANERAGRTAEAQRREQAESERDLARGAVQTESGRRWQAEEQALDTSLSSLATEMDALEERYGSLIENGQFKEAAKVQRRMTEAAADARLAQEKKVWLTDARRLEEEQQSRRAPSPQQREGEIDLSNYSPQQRRWIRDEHPEYLTDARFRAKVAAAHFDAIAEGYDIDSDDYFKHIEQMAGKKAPIRPQETEIQEEPSSRRRVAPEVPVQRRTQQSTQREAALRLTEDEREAADIALPHLPEQDEVDGKGNVVKYGRYRQYKIHQKALRDSGRLN